VEDDDSGLAVKLATVESVVGVVGATGWMLLSVVTAPAGVLEDPGFEEKVPGKDSEDA